MIKLMYSVPVRSCNQRFLEAFRKLLFIGTYYILHFETQFELVQQGLEHINVQIKS